MGISGRALLAAMGMSEGKLGAEQERLYYDLAFLAGACGGHLPRVSIARDLAEARTPEARRAVLDRENPLGDIFWELEAYANPTQTGRKLDWGCLGRVYGGSASEYDRTRRDFGGIVGQRAPRVECRGLWYPDPSWTAEMAAEQGAEIRARLTPVLVRFGLRWPVQKRTGSRHRYGLR